MRQEAVELLEFPKLIEIIAGMTQSSGGRKHLEEIRPLGDAAAILARRQRISEAVRLQTEGKGVSLLLEGDPRVPLSLLKWETHILEIEDFLLLRGYLQAGLSLLSILKSSDCEHLKNDWLQVPPLSHLLQAVSRTFDDEGEVRDEAHPELAETRNRKRQARRTVQKHLDKLLNKHQKALIPDAFVTQRNHRYVIPVRVEAQKAVPGIMHAASSSGATVFIEPFSAVELNNQCLYLDDLEKEIIQRIMTQLTGLFREARDPLLLLLDRLDEFDALQAIARYSQKFRCVMADFSEQGRLALEGARHPLLMESLGAEAVVPLSVKLDGKERALIISGPNTGGKTVALKTIGLLAMAAHAALPVPAQEAVFPRFKQLQADIGDHQSIAENLSTFSAHILRIRRILEDLETPSLVLLDEIGSGTDPVYGGALGIAIVDRFRKAGATLVATTHLRAVKVYASRFEDVVSASVGLNSETLRPSYELTLGSSGESSALEIAAQLGLPSDLVQQAREFLSEEERLLEHYLDELKAEKKSLEGERARMAEIRRQFDRERREQQVQLANTRKELEKEFEKQLKRVEDEYKRDVSRFLKSTQDRMEAARLKQQAARRQEALKRRAREEMLEREERKPVTTTTLASGQEVYHQLFRKRGTVLEVKGEQAVLEIEGKKVSAPISQLSRIEQKTVTREPSKRVVVHVVEDTDPELKLVGKRVEEALDLLDKFLDRAFLSGLPEVRIIHGFGTGRLKQAVHELLQGHPHVKGHRLDGGATLAQLKT